MATNNIETRLFSRDAVVCVLRNFIPSSYETKREVESLKRFLQFNFHNIITMCMHIDKIEVYSSVIGTVSPWWLEVISNHQASWKGDQLIVTPVPEEALGYFLDNVVAQA